MSKDNTLTLTFNERVVVQSKEALQDSMQISIVGPNINYDFQYKILEMISSSNATSSKRNLSSTSGVPTPVPVTPTSVQSIRAILVQVYDIKVTLKGGGFEKANIWFKDNSVIKDLAGNSLAEGRVVAALRSYEYVPEGKFIQF